MDKKMVETTTIDFELFVRECQRWIEIYALKRWDIHFAHDDDNGNLASCATNLNAMSATITFAKKWSAFAYSFGVEEIKKCAFHEVTELLMAPVDGNARHRYITEEDMTESIHAVIRTLENILYPKYKVESDG